MKVLVPFSCERCGKTMATEGGFTLHLASHVAEVGVSQEAYDRRAALTAVHPGHSHPGHSHPPRPVPATPAASGCPPKVGPGKDPGGAAGDRPPAGCRRRAVARRPPDPRAGRHAQQPRPPYRGHSERVRAFTALLAAELKLPQEDRDRLHW